MREAARALAITSGLRPDGLTRQRVAGPPLRLDERVQKTRGGARPSQRLASVTRADVWDALSVTAVGCVVVAAATWGSRLGDDVIHASAPPLQGQWSPQWTWSALIAVAVAAVVVTFGARVASAIRWPWVPWLSSLTAVVWLVAVASTEPWQRAFADRLTTQYDYLAAVPSVGGWSDLLGGFAARIPFDAVERWPTHVAGHPPGIMVPFVGLDRLGLDGPTPAAVLLVVVGGSTAAALVVAARALTGEVAARRLAPFAALAPGAVWIAVSGDALILGATSWAVALVAIACTRESLRWAVGAGVLVGVCLYLSYGMVLILGVVAVVLLTRGTWRVAAATASAVLMVIAVVTLAGFNWYEGYLLVVERYADGLGGLRPYSYWVWANLAAFAIAVGPAAVVGVRRAVAALTWPADAAPRTWLTWVRDPQHTVALVSLAAVAVALVATIGGLSKGEVERIWLPFGAWVLLAVVSIPADRLRWWLGAQAAVVVLVPLLVVTPW